MKDLVNDWNKMLKLLSIIVENQPQTAYLAFVSGFRSELNCFMRRIPEFRHHLVPWGGRTLQSRFITAIAGGHIYNSTEQKLFLPTRFGGLAIPIFYEQAEYFISKQSHCSVQ